MNEKPAEPLIGWREWLALPAIGVVAVKAKIDTGARSSSLHAIDIEEFERDGKTWVRFQTHPIQRSSKGNVKAEAEVIEYRNVRSSNGQASMRPVIVTNVLWHGNEWPVELTLTARDGMSFRMLLGREAIRHRYLVDAGKSWYGGKPDRSIRKPT